MKGIMLFFYFSTLFICGCSSYPKNYSAVKGEVVDSSDKGCIDLFNEIEKKWAVYHTKLKEGECYFYNKKLTERILEHRDCFIGLKIDEVTKLLGEPSQISGHNYFYLMSKNCSNEYDYINDKYHHLRFTALDTIGTVDYYPIATDY